MIILSVVRTRITTFLVPFWYVPGTMVPFGTFATHTGTLVPWYQWYTCTMVRATRVRTYLPWYHGIQIQRTLSQKRTMVPWYVYHGTKVLGHVYYHGTIYIYGNMVPTVPWRVLARVPLLVLVPVVRTRVQKVVT